MILPYETRPNHRISCIPLVIGVVAASVAVVDAAAVVADGVLVSTKQRAHFVRFVLDRRDAHRQ